MICGSCKCSILFVNFCEYPVQDTLYIIGLLEKFGFAARTENDIFLLWTCDFWLHRFQQKLPFGMNCQQPSCLYFVNNGSLSVGCRSFHQLCWSMRAIVKYTRCTIFQYQCIFLYVVPKNAYSLSPGVWQREFRHNKIVQSPHENYFNVCRQYKEK